ncbi:hypothetical protein [Streptomyces sp. NPDC052693]|uniref:hypothetical protein n=1 Tax=Streptomyces sp. NPDC052693 TaxID=3155814 RepID=UPI003447DCE6
MTLFGDEAFSPHRDERELAGLELRARVRAAVEGLSTVVGEDVQALLKRVLALVNLPGLSATDDHDLREVLAELRLCEREGRGRYKRRLRRETHVERPAGIGRLPRPRWVKAAAAAGTCGLCADGYAAGDMIGRAQLDPKLPHHYVPMGWLCWHCLVQRRQCPTRRDVLLRIFHGLFADEGVGFNGHECGVLLEWLTSDLALAGSKPWTADPLETTLVRLRASAADGKPVTWLSPQTARTIVAVLQEPTATAVLTGQEAQLLTSVAQHLTEWDTNPAGVRHAQYGTGWRFRQRALALTEHPTALSRLGGPFFLFQCKVTALGALKDPDKS